MTAAQRQKQITDTIERAQRLLEHAAELACPLDGWEDHWTDIRDASSHVQALWRRIHQAPVPGEPVVI